MGKTRLSTIDPRTLGFNGPCWPNTNCLIKNHEEENAGSGPRNKGCAYCKILDKSKGITFTSHSTKKSYKIRQRIDCETPNIIYLVSCKKHNIQGVGQTGNMKKRVSNYKNHHKAKYKKCGITEHFLESGHNLEEDFIFQPIVKIVNILSNRYQGPRIIRERLEEFELYWQDTLMTIEPKGMNKQEEVDRARKKISRRRKKDSWKD